LTGMQERGCEGSEDPRQENGTNAAFHRVLSLKETSLLQLPTAKSQLPNVSVKGHWDVEVGDWEFEG
jgi:hypothetical protein